MPRESFSRNRTESFPGLGFSVNPAPIPTSPLLPPRGRLAADLGKMRKSGGARLSDPGTELPGEITRRRAKKKKRPCWCVFAGTGGRRGRSRVFGRLALQSSGHTHVTKTLQAVVPDETFHTLPPRDILPRPCRRHPSLFPSSTGCRIEGAWPAPRSDPIAISRAIEISRLSN